MKILVAYRGIPQSPEWATGDLVVKAFRNLGHDVTPYGTYYQTDVWMEEVDPVASIREAEYDLALYMECNDADPAYGGFKLVKARKTACWLFDTSYYADNLVGFNQFFNFEHQFIANPRDLNKFPNSSYLPYAVDSDLHGREITFKKEYDFALPGTVRQDRVSLSQSLSKKGIRLELISGLFREEYIDALAKARVVINQNPDQGRGLLNMRYWEAMAAGALILTEHSDFNDNAREMEWNGMGSLSGLFYDGVDNLVSICERLSEDRNELEKERSGGQLNVLRHHTYKQRCKRILQLLFPHEA